VITATEHQHTAPDYYGRIEAPSRALRDYAQRTGAQIHTFTVTLRLPEA
jgi:hypothetical protein